MSTQWGAFPYEWVQWSQVLGLTEDLLPVVCAPGAKIDPSSKLSSYGKVPSLYRPGTRSVIGMPHWTSRTSYPHDIEMWSAEPDYGICLQTRHIRALDCDLTDPDIAADVFTVINRWFTDQIDAILPIRTRADSSKFLVLFEIGNGDGETYPEYGKRVMKTKGGIIEFLGNGQQCLVAGTHKDGARYEWGSALPSYIPILDAGSFDCLWTILESCFATEEPTIARPRKPRGTVLSDNPLTGNQGETQYIDPVVLLLRGKDLVLDTDADGRVHFTCPWSELHTKKGDVTETTYFPEGTGGYEKGHFDCRHAHCAERTDADFLDALGWTLEGFEPLPDETYLAPFGISDADDLIGAPPIVTALPPLSISPALRDVKTGIIRPVLPAAVAILSRPDLTGCSISFDAFKDSLIVSWDDDPPHQATDGDMIRLRLLLTTRFQVDPKLSQEVTSHAAQHVGEQVFPFDSAIRLAESLTWDGTPRVSRFYEDYIGIPSYSAKPYAAACSRYLWTALAGRLLVPGIQADMALVWIGEQGSGKTSSVRAIALQEDHYVELDISEKDDDLSRLIRGKTIAELSELRGIRTRDLESIKSFISRRVEEFVSKYQERSHQFKRRFLMVGTSNQEDFLIDSSGNRRFLPIRVGQQAVDAIIRDREQLWAEAILIFKREGILWQEAEELARGFHDQFMEDDPWMDQIAEWLDAEDLGGMKNRERAEIRTLDVASHALHMNVSHMNGGISKRIGGVLRRLGYVPKLTSTGRLPNNNRGWVKK